MTDKKTTGSIELELATYNEFFQSSFHSESTENEGIPSRFFFEVKKMAWCGHTTEQIASVVTSEKHEFTANKKYDFLLYTYLIQKLPTIEVDEKWKERVQICWPHNCMHNIVKEGIFSFDGEPVQTINSYWLDIVYQWLFEKKEGRSRKNYGVMIGNIPFLEKWDTKIPGYTLALPLPWSYAKFEGRAVPLSLCSLTSVKHTFDFRRKYSEILRMRARENPNSTNWKIIKYNFEYLKSVTHNSELCTPELWAEYAKITERERKFWLEDYEGSSPELIGEDIVHDHTDEEKIRYGKIIEFTIKETYPVKSIFWFAENMNASSLNNFSNYTTNTDDYKYGWDPIQYFSASYGAAKRNVEMSSIHSGPIQGHYQFPSAPFEQGYHGLSFGFNLGSGIQADTGFTFKKCPLTLKLKLSDTNPFLRIITEKSESSEGLGKEKTDKELVPDEFKENGKLENKGPSFKVHLFSLIIRKFKCNLGGNKNNIEMIFPENHIDTSNGSSGKTPRSLPITD